MPLLHVAFQEGFSGDQVVARLNGEEIFRKSGMKTRLQTGFADSVEVEAPDGPATLAIELPDRNISQSIPITVSGPTYVGISLSSNAQVTHKISQEPFGYV
jgi:hypothetical protein